MLKESTSNEILLQTFVNMVAEIFAVRNRCTLFLNCDQNYSWVHLVANSQNLEL